MGADVPPSANGTPVSGKAIPRRHSLFGGRGAKSAAQGGNQHNANHSELSVSDSLRTGAVSSSTPQSALEDRLNSGRGLSGYLYKACRAGLVRVHWQKCKVCLNGGELVYGISNSKGKGQAKFLKLGVGVRLDDTGLVRSNGQELFTFAIYERKNQGHEGRRHRFGALSPEQAAAWIEEITATVLDMHDQEIIEDATTLQRDSKNSDEIPAALEMSEEHHTIEHGRTDSMDLSNADLGRTASIGAVPKELHLWADFDKLEASTSKHNAFCCGDGERSWKLLSVKSGLRYFEERGYLGLGHSLRAVTSVSGSPDTVFRLLMSYERSVRGEWDFRMAKASVIETVDGHTDIVHEELEPIKLPNALSRPRDLCMLRYWRRDSDGSYVIIYRSTETPKCPVTRTHVRAELVGGAFIISPQLRHDSMESLVVHWLEMDPRGWVSAFDLSKVYMMKVLKRLAGLKELLQQTSPAEVRELLSLEPNLCGSDTSDTAEVYPKKGLCKSASFSEKDQQTALTEMQGNVGGTVRFGGRRSPSRTNCWLEPHASFFNIRSKKYLKNQIKIPSKPAQLTLVAVDWLKSDNKIERIATHPDHPVEKYLKHTDDGYTIVFNLQAPAGPTHYSLVLYYHTTQPIDPSSLLGRFIHGSDAFRNSRMKLLPCISKGPWMVQKGVGRTPLIVGSALKVNYFKLEKYFEADIDIGTSAVACGITRFVIGYVKHLVIDMGMVIQGNCEEELPERLLGTVQISHLELKEAREYRAFTTPSSEEKEC